MILEDYIAHKKNIFFTKTDENVKNRHTITKSDDNFYIKSSDLDHEDFRHESFISNFVSVYGIPTVFNVSLGDTTQILGIAAGNTLDTYPIEEKKILYKDLGWLLARLHRLQVIGCGPIYTKSNLYGVHSKWSDYIFTQLNEHFKYLHDKLGYDNKRINEMENIFIESKFDLDSKISIQGASLLHGDLSDKNIFGILFGEDAFISAIIDWEDSIGGDYIYDLSFWATFHAPEFWPSLIDSYFIETQKPERFDFFFWIYYLRISIAKIILLHKNKVPDLSRSFNRIKMAMENIEI